MGAVAKSRPQVQQQMQQGMQLIQQQGRQLQQAQQRIQALEQAAQLKARELDLKEQALRIKGFEAETARSRRSGRRSCGCRRWVWAERLIGAARHDAQASALTLPTSHRPSAL